MPGINQSNLSVPAQKYLPEIVPVKVTTVAAITDKIRRDVHKTAKTIPVAALTAANYVKVMEQSLTDVFKDYRNGRGHKAIIRLYTITEALMHFAELMEKHNKPIVGVAPNFKKWSEEISKRDERELHAFGRSMCIDEDATTEYLNSMKENANLYDFSQKPIQTVTRLSAVLGQLQLAYVDWLKSHVIGMALKFATPGKPLDILLGVKSF